MKHKIKHRVRSLDDIKALDGKGKAVMSKKDFGKLPQMEQAKLLNMVDTVSYTKDELYLRFKEN